MIAPDVIGIPFPDKLVPYMDFGVEVSYSFRPVPDFVRLTISRDGIRFYHLAPPASLWKYLVR